MVFKSLKMALEDLKHKIYFWFLAGFALLGIILDGHSTFLFVQEFGYKIEANILAAFLWAKLDFLGFLPGFAAGCLISLAILILLIFGSGYLFIFLSNDQKSQKRCWKIFVLSFLGLLGALRIFVAIHNYNL